MSKKVLSFLFFITIIAAQAQDKAVEVKVKEGYVNVGTNFTQNGKFFFVTDNDKTAKKTTVNITCFDSLLNTKYSTDIFPSKYNTKPSYASTTPQYLFNMYVSEPYGKHVVGVLDQVNINEDGKLKNGFIYNFVQNLEIKNFDAKFDIITDDYKCFFGSKKPEGGKKDEEETTFLRIGLNDGAERYIPIDFPSFKSLITAVKVQKSAKEEAKKLWGIAQYDDKQFFMINKELSKDWSQNQYNIVSFDYDGKLTPDVNLSLLLQLSKNKYFALSDTGFGSSKIVTGYMVGGAYMDESSTGNIYVEGKNEFYYIYGLYANEKNSNMNKAKYNGFYVFKYNAKGELLWKTEQEISNSNFNELQRPLAIAVDLKMMPNNQFGFSIYSYFEKYAHLFLMNSKDGKILKSQSPIYKIDQYRQFAVSHGSFCTGFVMAKEYKNKYMDFNTMFAAFLSPKVNTLLSKPSTGDLNYNCEVTRDGIYMIEEDMTTKKFQLMKFNW